MLASGVGGERQSARECTNGQKAGPIAAREVPVGIPIGSLPLLNSECPLSVGSVGAVPLLAVAVTEAVVGGS
jgi:hypothetical protein